MIGQALTSQPGQLTALPFRLRLNLPDALRFETNRAPLDLKKWICPMLLAQESFKSLIIKWWLGAELNRRHKDFQSSALPTELPSQPNKHCIKMALMIAVTTASLPYNPHELAEGIRKPNAATTYPQTASGDFCKFQTYCNTSLR
jgi:hypothetical protein